MAERARRCAGERGRSRCFCNKATSIEGKAGEPVSGKAGAPKERFTFYQSGGALTLHVSRHQLVQRGAGVTFVDRRQMRVNDGDIERGMAEVLGDEPQGNTFLQQVRGITMAQRVDTTLRMNAALGPRQTKGIGSIRKFVFGSLVYGFCSFCSGASPGAKNRSPNITAN